jgi:hypothetical protein
LLFGLAAGVGTTVGRSICDRLMDVLPFVLVWLEGGLIVVVRFWTGNAEGVLLWVVWFCAADAIGAAVCFVTICAGVV